MKGQEIHGGGIGRSRGGRWKEKGRRSVRKSKVREEGQYGG